MSGRGPAPQWTTNPQAYHHQQLNHQLAHLPPRAPSHPASVPAPPSSGPAFPAAHPSPQPQKSRPRPSSLPKVDKTKHLSLAAKRALKAQQAHAKAHKPAVASPSSATAGGGGKKAKSAHPSRSRPSSAGHPLRSHPGSRLQSRAASPLPSPSLFQQLHAQPHTAKEIEDASHSVDVRSAYPSPSPSPAQPPAPVLGPAPSPSPSSHAPQHQQQQQHYASHPSSEEDERGRSNHPRLLWRSVLEHDTVDALDEYCQVKWGVEMPKPDCLARHSSRGRRPRRLTEVEAESWARQLDRTGF